jgi:methionyl aminopeptidase
MTTPNKPRRELRSLREIKKMRAAGLIVWEAHQAAAKILRPGVTTEALNAVYRDTFQRYQAEPLFLNYGEIPNQRPAFPAETCISVNEELVHGIPGSRVLKEGDIVSLDTGCRLAGWCADAAVTHPIGQIDSTKQQLLQVTQGVLDLAIELMGVKSWWSEVAREMHDYVNDTGMGVIKDMVGHGIGKQLHEAPQVPNYFSRQWKDNEDFDLRPGVVLAVEPMVGYSTDQLLELEDKWTIITKDRSPSAHFEHTIAITQNGPQRLTGPPDPSELAELPAWLQSPVDWVIW